MVAAMLPSSPITPAENALEMQTDKKREAGNVHNYGSRLPAEKVKVVRKSRTLEILSKYKSSIASPLVTPARSRCNTSPLSRNPSPARQPLSAPSSRQSSPVTNHSNVFSSSSSARGPSESLVRQPSAKLGRSSSGSEVLKRSDSTGRRRQWPAVSPSSENKSTSSSFTTDGLVLSNKAQPLSKGPGLWPSMSAAEQSANSDQDSVSNCQAERGRKTETTGKHPTHNLKSAGNENDTAHFPDPPCQKGYSIRRQSADQAENARPTENSHSKFDRQRWPGMRSGKVFGGNMARSVDLTVKRERSLAQSSTTTARSRPATPLSRTTSISSSIVNRSINDGPTTTPSHVRRNPSPSRSKTRTTESVAQVSVASRDSDDIHPCSTVTFQGDHATLLRRLSQESVATVDSLSLPLETISNTESVSSGSCASGIRVGRGTTIPACGWQDMSNRLRRFSEGVQNRSSDVDHPAVGIVSVKTVRCTKVLPHQSTASMLLNQSTSGSTSSWALSPVRVPGSSAPLISHPSSSPSHMKGTSPLSGLCSPQRSRAVYGSAAALAGSARNFAGTTLYFGIDGRSRGKKAPTRQEETQLLRILHNRWLQWRFVNARAEAVTRAQKATAERQLYDVWVMTSELRTSVAMQRIKLQRARQAHKLRSILSTHAIHLEEWEILEKEHSNALTDCMEALESAILRIPVTGGARTDVHTVKDALYSAADIFNAIEGSVSLLLPKTEHMRALLSRLAETAAQERALLEECGDLLSLAASLEVEERSLRTHLIQLGSEGESSYEFDPANTA